MEEKQKRILTIILVVVNVAVWSLLIVPRIGVITSALVEKPKTDDSQFLPRSEATKQILEKIDFYALRDPFIPLSGIQTGSKEKAKTVQKTTIQKEQTPQVIQPTTRRQEEVQKSFISQFKLKGIALLGEKYMATLEEAAHYGASYSAPYSTKWGTESYGSSERTYTVFEGDTILGERVVEIGADFVILTKNKLYYKLTFSGGYPIEGP